MSAAKSTEKSPPGLCVPAPSITNAIPVASAASTQIPNDSGGKLKWVQTSPGSVIWVPHGMINTVITLIGAHGIAERHELINRSIVGVNVLQAVRSAAMMEILSLGSTRSVVK